MRPVLFEFFGQSIHSYTFFLSAGFLVATLLCVRDAERLKEPLYLPTQHAVWLFLGGLIGAKVFFILQFESPAQLWRALVVWEGGLVYYGAFIGAFVAAVTVMYFLKLPYLKVTDAIAPYVPLGQAFGRTGCFLNGCCWGRVSDVPWSIRFPQGSIAHQHHVNQAWLDASASTSLPVHPTQLYSVFGLIGLFFLLRFVLRNKPFDGAAMLSYLLLYGTLRFVVESFRGDSARSVFNFLTVSQLVSLILVSVSLLGFALAFGLRPKGMWKGSPLPAEPNR